MVSCFQDSQLSYPAFLVLAIVLFLSSIGTSDESALSGNFNRDVRAILANNCFQCHGPDEKQRQANLRLDTVDGVMADLDGRAAIVRGNPEASELVRRITQSDINQRMPPAETGKILTPDEIDLLIEWIRQGAPYTEHWSYIKPFRPELPQLNDDLRRLAKNEIDHFVAARLQQENLSFSPEANRYTLIRRLSLDLTGLPPTWKQVEQFVSDSSPVAYERLVDRLCNQPSFAEHWARMWLDLARYADSAGYADDPPRTIWAYRDWVIRAINTNLPFDHFTIEQLAGDLLPNPRPDQLIATTFHRNTLTNNEGGTNDEEFRNVAIVDRVNTTMQVWMGTTIRCAQCHDHKYDPLSQKEYFQLFALLNNTEDADRGDESPLLTVMTDEIEQKKANLEKQLRILKNQLIPSDEDLATKQVEWKGLATRCYEWKTLIPVTAKSTGGATLTIHKDGSILAEGDSPETDTYFLEFETPLSDITALQIEVLPDNSLPMNGPGRADDGNFVLSRLKVADNSDSQRKRVGRFVRIDLPGNEKMIHLAEIVVLNNAKNIAREGKATQSSTDFGGSATRAIDGNTDGIYTNNSVTHTSIQKDPWLEIDLGELHPIDSISVWNRTDANLQSRLNGFILSVLNENRDVVWKEIYKKAPQREQTVDLTGAVSLLFTDVSADAEQVGDKNSAPYDGWVAEAAIDDNKIGWAVGGFVGNTSRAVFQLKESVGVEGERTRLQFTLEQQYGGQHTLGHFRISATAAEIPVKLVPSKIAAILHQRVNTLENSDKQRLVDYYQKVVPPRTEIAEKIAAKQKQLTETKPTTVPIMRELPPDQHRHTHIQHRGNFLDLGDEVTARFPAAFHALPPNESTPINRLTLAKWLVDARNPLTARVAVNRYWESIFGVGLVLTSEEFGSQGEQPSHPQLLDWLATELTHHNWDTRTLLRLLVNSAAYRQSSAVTPELYERDPDNRLLARGPRFRITAEMIRDQALFVSGLLQEKLYGPPVRPPQPKLDLTAAFGSSVDWESSQGADRYRRALYTTWRRSSPYPSMATFDAPNREVCTIRRTRTNTPLQALVTLNDPVYVEAAQNLARRIHAVEGNTLDKVRHGFRICLARNPNAKELERLVELYQQSYLHLKNDADKAHQLATVPLGRLPDGTNPVPLAAWTVVGNVLLNLDEIFLKR